MTGARKQERSAKPWRFFQDEDARWRWKYVMNGKAVAQAYEAFADYADCVADARTHGYVEVVNREP
jgi:hypothetical protein